jgi:hypothetical protein
MQGIRTVIVTNGSANLPKEREAHRETWTLYPDYGREKGTYYPGDIRAALTPLIAYIATSGSSPSRFINGFSSKTSGGG